MKAVAKPTRFEVVRDVNDPPLSLGETVEIREGLSGTIIAQYVSADDHTKAKYIVEPNPSEE